MPGVEGRRGGVGEKAPIFNQVMVLSFVLGLKMG